MANLRWSKGFGRCSRTLCNNPRKNDFFMGPFRFVLVSIGASLLGCVVARGQAPPLFTPNAPASIPMVLAGGTVIDVTDWGHSAVDLPDAIVIMRDGRITDVGSRMAVSIPKGARVIEYRCIAAGLCLGPGTSAAPFYSECASVDSDGACRWHGYRRHRLGPFGDVD